MTQEENYLPRTENPNPLTEGIDTWDITKILQVMNEEDHKVAPAVAKELPNIAKGVKLVVESLSQEGRLFYIGSGTSGRLGVLDAAELHPTFGLEKDKVIPIIAGGKEAIFHPIEGAEDKEEDGRKIFLSYNPTKSDVVIGISASGRTPFVAGAMKAAQELGIPTIAVVGDSNGKVSQFADVVISPDVGPEVIAGSTRLKNGTAQKMVLNMISTAAMICMGRTYSNLMAGTYTANKKLWGRAKRIIQQASGCDEEQAERALEETGGNVPVALVTLLCQVEPKEAEMALNRTNNSIKNAVRMLSNKTSDDQWATPLNGQENTFASLTYGDNLKFGNPEDAGFDPGKLERAFQVVGDTVGDGEGPIPGAVSVVIRNGITIWPRCWGWAVRKPEKIAMTPYTVFDMASLTKVMATTPSILLLTERAMLRLDDPVCMFIPEFGCGGKEYITIRHLLTHTSGLPDHIKFWEQGLKGKEIIDAICNLNLPENSEPGTHVLYSDLGFIILAEIVYRITGSDIAEFSKREVFEPLGMKSTGFLPLDSMKKMVAATEYREDLGRVMWGQVHDENAYALGEIAGHAGLFSTPLDTAIYAQMWLNPDKGSVLSKAAIQTAIREQVNLEERRGLGWMLTSRTFCSGGDFLSDSAFGHTGFTGTSLWCDPEKNLAIILLTNRVHAGREGTSHIRLRARFANAVCAAIRA